ncbi:MAG: hypothetical protein IKE69_07605 [Thermoguttaceae bacterium]|nr:hypothetical protein [Thermoguttaceae bacterium]
MKKIKNRSLRLESLEDRMLLAVTAGGEAAAAELVAPAETGAEVVVTDITFNGFRRALTSAQAGDTIRFDGSGTITITSAIQLTKNVTIDGGGQVTFQGAGENFLFTFGANATDVTFTGLGLTGGYATRAASGGLFAVGAGKTVTLDNCDIYGNVATDTDAGYVGGAIYVTGTLNVNGCNVYGNEAVYGGFAYINGQGTSATVNATNSNFYGNTADTGSVFWNDKGTLNLTNCSVVANKGAGAIFNANFFGVGGTAGAYTHEFFITDTTVTNSIIAGNVGGDGANADVWEDYSRQLSGGGVLQWELYNIDDTFSKFDCENSIIGMMGDYFVAGPEFDAEGNLNFDTIDLTIRTDSVAAYAGIGANPGEYTGAGVEDYLVVTTLDDVADGSDGVVSLREAIEYATLGTFNGIPTITFAPELAGGTIALQNGQLAIIANMNIIADNITVDAGGDSRVLFLKSFDYQVAVEGNYQNFNSVPDCPKHDYAGYNINVTIDGLNFTGGADAALSRGSGGAGVLALQNVKLYLSNSTISDSVLAVTTDFAVEGASYTNIGGGGLAGIYYSDLFLDNVSVVDNAVMQTGDRATNIILAGGGIFVGKRSSLSGSELTVSGNELTSEYYLNSGYSQWGYGYGYGGGICVFGAAEIADSRIADNAIAGAAMFHKGGGVFHYLSNWNRAAAGRAYGLVITNTAVTGNSIGDHRVENNGWCHGGGIYNSGVAMLVNDLIAENTIDSQDNSVGMTAYIGGAGIYNGANSDYNSQGQNVNITQMDIYYSTITNNTTRGIDITDWNNWGSGIYNANSFADASKQRPVTGTINLVGSILYHNYSAQTDTTNTANVDTWNDDGAVFTLNNVLYNTSGIKGTGLEYTDCIRLTNQKVFNDEENGDYTPWGGTPRTSPAIDALTDTAPTPPAQYVSAYDLRGEPYVRVYGTAQDWGCYEYQPEPDPTFELELTAYTGVYDGQAHSITVGGIQDGDVVTYSADGVTYAADLVTFTDAGVGTVYVKAQREGYQEYNGSANVTISAKALTISGTKVADKVYDGTTDAVVTLGEVSGIVAGDDVTVTADAAFPQAEVGEYDVTVTYTVSGASASNYTAPADDVVTASITEQGGGEQLAAPTITTGNRGVYVSYGANRHNIQWGAVANASGYEVQYTVGGSTFGSVSVTDAYAVINGLAYGTDVTYRVRALGDGVSYTDSEWSASKTFNVCPMDINNDGDISGSDRNLLASSWLSEEGDDEYQYYADINGDGDVSGADRNFISNNWLGEAGDDDLTYPRPLAADAVFAAYEAGDLDVDFDVF